MKKSKAIVLVILSSILFYIFPIGKCYATDGDEIRAAKKVISVVYDDSGSMTGMDRWSYANYSMQALIALLNEQDELYITFMSDPSKAYSVDTSNLPGAIKTIHDWNDCGGTPGEALDTARAKLDDISESDKTVQFWLVIMTDGGIDLPCSLQDKLNSYKNNKMSNSTLLNTVYLAMGDGAVSAKGDPNKQLYTYTASNDASIVGTLQDIANLISGRINADQVTQIDDKTISVKSTLPLYSLSILSQKSSATVKEAKTSEEKLNVLRNISLDATNLTNGVKIDSLYGNASVINNQDNSGNNKVIPADTYIITFSDKVDINNMNIQFEPAIGLKAEISRNGVVIDDTSKLGNGDKVDIKIIPVVPGTDEEIAASDLPKQITWDINYEVDGNIIDSGSGIELTGVTLTHGNNIIRGIINIPGYSPFISEIHFSIAEIVYNFGIQVIEPSVTSYMRSDMKKLTLDDSNTYKFFITNDGKPLSKDEQKAIDVELELSDINCTPLKDGNIVYKAGHSKVKCKLEQNDDGSYSLIPSCPTGIPIIGLQAGKYAVKVSVSSDDTISETVEFDLVPSNEDAKDVPKIVIGFLVFLYLFYLFFIKKKFKGQTVHYECWRLQDDGRGVLQKGMSSSESLGFFSGHFLLPTKASYIKYHGLKLVAESGGSVIVTGDSIAHTVVKYGTSTSKPEKHLRAIESHLHKTEKKNGQREASDQDLSSKPIYFKSSDSTRDIWRIWLTND